MMFMDVCMMMIGWFGSIGEAGSGTGDPGHSPLVISNNDVRSDFRENAGSPDYIQTTRTHTKIACCIEAHRGKTALEGLGGM